MTLTARLYLTLSLKMGGAMLPLPLCPYGMLQGEFHCTFTYIYLFIFIYLFTVQRRFAVFLICSLPLTKEIDA